LTAKSVGGCGRPGSESQLKLRYEPDTERRGKIMGVIQRRVDDGLVMQRGVEPGEQGKLVVHQVSNQRKNLNLHQGSNQRKNLNLLRKYLPDVVFTRLNIHFQGG